MMGVNRRTVGEDNLLTSSFLPSVYRLDKIIYFRVRNLNVRMFWVFFFKYNFSPHDCNTCRTVFTRICRVSRKKTFLHWANLRSLQASKNSSHFFWTSWESRAAKHWPTDLLHQPRPPTVLDLRGSHAVSVTRERAGRLGAEPAHGVPAGSSCSRPLCLPGTSLMPRAIRGCSPRVGSIPSAVPLLLQDGVPHPDHPAQSGALARGSVSATTWFPLITCSLVPIFSRRRAAGEVVAAHPGEVREGKEEAEADTMGMIPHGGTVWGRDWVEEEVEVDTTGLASRYLLHLWCSST